MTTLLLLLLSQYAGHTNQVLHSGDFANVAWEGVGTIRPRSEISPANTPADNLDGSWCQWLVLRPGPFVWSVYVKGEAWLEVEDVFGWWLTSWWPSRSASPPSAWVRLSAKFNVESERFVRVCVVAGKAPVWGAQVEEEYVSSYIETTSVTAWCVSSDPSGCPP